jgi:hypothetical protein
MTGAYKLAVCQDGLIREQEHDSGHQELGISGWAEKKTTNLGMVSRLVHGACVFRTRAAI